jgi:Pilin accessory protein (PilO)
MAMAMKHQTAQLITDIAWFVDDNEAAVHAEKKRMVAQLKAKSMLLHHLSHWQLGLTTVAPASNRYSAAVLLQYAATKFEWGSNWLAIVSWGPDSDRYWVVASRSGVIYPTSDVVLRTEEAIKAADKIRFDSTRWDRIFDQLHADPSDVVASINVIEILEGSSPEALNAARLKPATNTKAILRYGAFAILLFSAIAVATWWNAKTELEKQRAQEATAKLIAEQREVAERALKLKRAEPVLAFAPPWYTEPLPSDLLDACEAVQSRLPISVLGWQRASLSCSPSSVTAKYARLGSTASPVQVLEQTYPKADVSQDGNSATLSLALKVTASPYQITSDKKTVRSELISVAQVLGVQISITDVPPPPDVSLGIAAAKARAKDVDSPRYVEWHTMGLTATLQRYADARQIARSPNLRLQSVDLVNGQLTLKGTLYAPL